MEVSASNLRVHAEIDRLLLEVATVSQLYERNTRAGREAPKTKQQLLALVVQIARLRDRLSDS